MSEQPRYHRQHLEANDFLIKSKSNRDQEQEQEIYPVTEGLKTPRTRYVYSKGFKHFLDHIKIHDLQQLLDYSPKTIESFIIAYVKHLRDRKQLKYRSIQVELAAIFHFFEMNTNNSDSFEGLSSGSKKKIKRFLPSDDSTYDDRPYTVEEIARILSKCDERSKAIILLMASTGIRIGAIHSLRIGHLTEMQFQGLKIYRVLVYAGTNDMYYTFTTPECYNAIQDYLQTRERFGEGGEGKPIKDKAPLIREQFNIEDNLRIQYPRSISHSMILHVVDQVLRRSGVKTSEVMRSHAFRKRFKSICERSGMKSINVELLMGHQTGLNRNYYRPSEFDLLEDYMAHAADSLTIDPTCRLERQVSKLESEKTEEIDRLKKQVSKLETESKENAKTKEQFIAYIQEIVEEQNQNFTKLSEYAERSHREATEIYRKAVTEMKFGDKIGI